MPSVPIFPPDPSRSGTLNPLPSLLKTPSGYALLELQGSIHTPAGSASSETSGQIPVGELIFPLYDPNAPTDDKAWMKKVYLYVGQYQRLTGQVKELPKAFALVGRRSNTSGASAVGDVDMDAGDGVAESGADSNEELEIVEIVKYKIVFSSRPEPVGGE